MPLSGRGLSSFEAASRTLERDLAVHVRRVVLAEGDVACNQSRMGWRRKRRRSEESNEI